MDDLISAINWFEIPVADFERAREFYATILDFDMPVNRMGERRMGFFTHKPGAGIGGAIVEDADMRPSPDGSLVYLNGGADLTGVLVRIESAGGKIEIGKHLIKPGLGYVAVFRDSEGNRVALHSMA